MSDYYHDDYDEYDPFDHMTNDPVHFAQYGYGGFGYDTSHVKHESMPDMCIAASTGDLNGVKQFINVASAISEDAKNKVINYARRWTEVDYKMSGFTKEWEWFDLTPLASAAKMGRHEVVEFLLREGADPTLQGCPNRNGESDGAADALECALRNLAHEKRLQQGSSGHNKAQRCVDLLTVANLYWDKAKYSEPHFSVKARATFTNRPHNLELLQLALAEDVADISEYPQKQLRGTPRTRKDKEIDSYMSTLRVCEACNKSTMRELFYSDKQISKGKHSKCKECVRKERADAARKADIKTLEQVMGMKCYDDDDNDDDYDYTEVLFFRPDGDMEGKDVQWCKDNDFFEVEEGLWSGPWYFKSDLYKKHSQRVRGKKHKQRKEAKKTAATTSSLTTPPRQSTPQLFTFGNSVGTASKSPTPFSFKKSTTNNEGSETKKESFSFGKAANTPSYGSSEKKKNQSTAIKSSSPLLNASNLFGSAEDKKIDAPDAVTSSSFSVGSPLFQFSNVSNSPDAPSSKKKPCSFDFTPKTTLSSGSNNLVSVESAISLLESLPLNELLPHHKVRLEALLARVSQGKKEDGIVVECGKSSGPKNTGDKYLDSIRSAVFDNDNLLSSILHFEGSLAMSEKLYDAIVGYENPKPFSAEDLFRDRFVNYRNIDYIRRCGTPSNALVCKKWKNFVIGDEGRKAWKIIVDGWDKDIIELAKHVINDEGMPWSARILAMAMANDVYNLEKAFTGVEDKAQGIWAAYEEAELNDIDDDYLRSLEVKCPRDHAFYKHCVFAQQFDGECLHREGNIDDWSGYFACNLAFAAAKIGANLTLAYLEEFLEAVSGDSLWAVIFNEKGDHFLGSLVEHACYFPMSEGPVSSIRLLLYGNFSSNDEIFYRRHSGCNGNNLHLAAARGHKSLVEALLDVGMDPSRPCTKINRGRSTDPSVTSAPLAADWAEARGHTEVVDLLRHYRSSARPDLRSSQNRYQVGKLTKFFPSSSRQYGFIEPGGIFVHLNQLRRYSVNDDDDRYPTPGQKLCFTVTTDRRGRKRADEILDGNDFSHLRLPLRELWDDPESLWRSYNYNGSDDSEEEDGYGFGLF